MHLLTLDTLSLTQHAHGNRFAAAYASLTAGSGAQHLGARLVDIPPGKRGWPLHCHHNNDEMFVILRGRGSLRWGTESQPVAAGQVVVCPAGGPETAHQLVNDGTETLRYLAISSMRDPDIMEYPDSGKIVAFAGAAPGGDKNKRRLSITQRKGPDLDYWDGE